MKLKRWKAKIYNIVISYLIVLMLLINANLAVYIVNDHKDDIKAALARFASLKSLSSAFINNAAEDFSHDAAGFIDNALSFFDEHIWLGPRLSKGRGTIQGPSGKETYYNLNMAGVVNIMRGMGYDYEYWVRDDGVKMFGNYVMIAANLNIRPRGSLVQTSLGMGMVCDTGTFARRNPTQIDIATAW
jgi:hypothetical protein